MLPKCAFLEDYKIYVFYFHLYIKNKFLIFFQYFSDYCKKCLQSTTSSARQQMQTCQWINITWRHWGFLTELLSSLRSVRHKQSEKRPLRILRLCIVVICGCMSWLPWHNFQPTLNTFHTLCWRIQFIKDIATNENSHSGALLCVVSKTFVSSLVNEYAEFVWLK